MILHVTKAIYVKDYQVALRFNDGSNGVADLKDLVARGGIFTELQETEKFKNFQLHHELSTIVWPNGADVAPESLKK